MTQAKPTSNLTGPRSKLTPDDVARLRAADARGVLNTREAARLYRVSPETIRRAIRGDTFGNLDLAQPRSEEELAQAAQESAARFLAAITQEREKQELPAKTLDELEEKANGIPDAGYD